MDEVTLLIHVLDLVGTFVFGISGAMLAVRKGMDLFGVLVLAFVTAVSGGIARDVLLGALPPAAVANWHALALSMAAGLISFRFHRLLDRLKEPVQFFDAAGLGVFAVAGTQKALDLGINGPMAAVLGTLGGIGGGMVRDVLTARVPTVLVAEIYAVAALAGAALVVAGSIAELPPVPVTLAGAALCTFLRLMAIYRGWRLPVARPPER